MGVVDGDHPFGAHDPDLQAVNRPRPDDRQGPTDVHAPDRAVAHGEDAEGRVLCPDRPQDLINRTGIELDRLLSLHQPHRHIQAVGPRYDHRLQVGPLAGPSERGQGDHPIHEGPGRDRRDVPDIAVAESFLDGQKPSPESVGVADHRIDPALPDGVIHPSGILHIRREGFFNEQTMPSLHGGEDRTHVVVLIGRDDGRIDFPALEQFPVVCRPEIGICLLGNLLGQRLIDVTDAEPPHSGIIPGKDRPYLPNRPGSHNRQADLFSLCTIRFHLFSSY